MNWGQNGDVPVAADYDGAGKSDPAVFRQTVLRAGGDPARAVMIGDSATDINTARAAGVPVVAVDFGYTETPVSALAPDRIISHFDALPAAVEALLGLKPQRES